MQVEILNPPVIALAGMTIQIPTKIKQRVNYLQWNQSTTYTTAFCDNLLVLCKIWKGKLENTEIVEIYNLLAKHYYADIN